MKSGTLLADQGVDIWLRVDTLAVQAELCYPRWAMRQPIQLNRHRRLGPDELTRKYLNTRGTEHADERDVEHEYSYHEYDDYWNPQSGRTADDYLIFGALEESVGFLCNKPKVGELLPASLAQLSAGEPAVAQSPEAQPRHTPQALPAALVSHIGYILCRASNQDDGSSQPFVYDGELVDALVRINGGMAGVMEALQRFAARPGPIVTALLFTPFWVRPLASWSPPTGDDATLTLSLIDHLFLVYPVPRALQQPWLEEGLPSLKWVSWLVLLGQGGNLHRAARGFGWSIAKRFSHHFAMAPSDLTTLEACMWSEIGRLGGDRVDFERIRQNPALVLDPTDAPDCVPEHGSAIESALPPAGDSFGDGAVGVPDWPRTWRREEVQTLAQTRAFWIETAEWLIRWHDRLTDETCAPILEWAVHLHTESLRPRLHLRAFTWRGREPASAHAAALAYLQERDIPYGDLTWSARGLDWESGAAEAVQWTVRELTSSKALAQESRAMHHCVASYAYRCVQGQTAIFSLCAAGDRRITVELDPFGHRIRQARGVCNRATTSEEQAVLTRWLLATASLARSADPG